MPRTPTRGPRDNWGLTEAQLDDLRRYFVDEDLTVQEAAHRIGISAMIARQIVKQKGWVPPPDPAASGKPNEPE